MARLLVVVLVVALAQTSNALAQTPAPPPPGETKFKIVDNSFLVEEAFNQEARIFQNIATWSRNDNGAWEGSFTQEWPVLGMTHQFSYTVPFSGGDHSARVGGVLLNYRYQLLEETGRRPASAPRLSVILPTGRRDDASDSAGLQVSLPFSKQAGDVYFHWNAGWTWRHGLQTEGVDRPPVNLTSPRVAGSVIWRTTPMFHLMLESVVEFEESVEDGARVGRERIVTIAPGFRRGWNVGDRQIVVGVAVPIRHGENATDAAALTYFSYELPFQR